MINLGNEQNVEEIFNKIKEQLEMLSVKNKLPAFNNFCSGDLDLEKVTLANYKENQT